MRVRLRPGLRALWRDGRTLQFGWGADPEVMYADPSAADLEILQSLEFLGVSHNRENRLLRTLADADLLVAATREPLPNISPATRVRIASDSLKWSIAAGQEEGWRNLEARCAARILVRGLGRTGSQLVRSLAHSGVGHIFLDDSSDVSPADLSPSGYGQQHIGAGRAKALQKIITAQYPDVTVTIRTEDQVDLAILTGYYIVDPVHYEEFLRADTAHLALVFNDFGAAVGPLTVPGRSPCLRCIDLHRVDADPAWPALATQLRSLGARESFSEEIGISALAAALATNMALRAVSLRGPEPFNATLEFSLDAYIPAVREWSHHPDCGCAKAP